jgi:anhydro-N-acetylmuramic acid kinase
LTIWENTVMQARLILGAMSGTSADGVDVAVVRIKGRGIQMSAELLHHHHRPFDADLRSRILEFRSGKPVLLADLAALGRDISLNYAEAVNAASTGFGPIEAIAAHGQTLFHAPPLTIQWLDPSLLASRTNCKVVSDFRRADCAVGGQGAPLVPFADFLLFRHPSKTRVLLNIGGIANLTYLPAAAKIDQLLAFDTGPGNCISDMLARPDADCDLGGMRAGRGTTIKPLLDRILAHDWFSQPPPKSTDGPAMIALFQADRLGEQSVDDLLCTACALTAQTIADAIRRFCPTIPSELIVSGGGVFNQTLMNILQSRLGNVPILTTDQLGIPSEAKEAVAFALLGAATLDGEPGNVPSCTGAQEAVILGSITPRPGK